jgi:hypothetical protein
MLQDNTRELRQESTDAARLAGYSTILVEAPR